MSAIANWQRSCFSHINVSFTRKHPIDILEQCEMTPKWSSLWFRSTFNHIMLKGTWLNFWTHERYSLSVRSLWVSLRIKGHGTVFGNGVGNLREEVQKFHFFVYCQSLKFFTSESCESSSFDYFLNWDWGIFGSHGSEGKNSNYTSAGGSAMILFVSGAGLKRTMISSCFYYLHS